MNACMHEYASGDHTDMGQSMQVVLVAIVVTERTSRTELESSLMQQEVAGCMQLAKEFKGTKAGQRKVTIPQKIEAMRCAQLIKMAHGGAAHKAAGTTQSLKYIDDENGPEARKPVWAPGRGYIKQPTSNPRHYVDFPSSSNQATTSGLNQDGKETCTCCAFAGCPCCQPAMHAPVTQLATHTTKKPFFHREGKWAKKHTQKLQVCFYKQPVMPTKKTACINGCGFQLWSQLRNL